MLSSGDRGRKGLCRRAEDVLLGSYGDMLVLVSISREDYSDSLLVFILSDRSDTDNPERTRSNASSPASKRTSTPVPANDSHASERRKKWAWPRLRAIQRLGRAC